MSVSKILFVVPILIVCSVIGANALDQSICSSGSNEELYPTGALKSCVLKDSFRSNDVNCKSQSPVSFYDNGRLEACILAEPVTISGQKCKEFEPINFYPDGKFRSCVKTD